MREIKFRAWTGLTMEYNVTVGKFGAFYVNPGAKGDGLDDKDTACLSPFNTIYSNQTPVMQYTGLKDKNGKEIYEGDIVEVIHQDHAFGRNPNSKEFACEVVFGNGEFFYRWPKDYGKYRFGSSLKFSEIIGNIYGSPNLLTNEK